jgi:hypothetical protein
MKKSRGKSAEAAARSEVPSRYLIQIDLGRRAGMEEIRKILERPDIEVDPSYGPILIDPAKGRYVVRGTATPSARQHAEANIPGVQFFGDQRIAPTAPDG